MATHPTPVVYWFQEINPGKFASVRHYELVGIKNGINTISEKINISKDRQFAKSNPDYWLKIREGNKWKTPAFTGLFKTDFPHIFHGDSQRKKNLILVHFAEDATEVYIYYFQDFYTRNIKALITETVRQYPNQ